MFMLKKIQDDLQHTLHTRQHCFQITANVSNRCRYLILIIGSSWASLNKWLTSTSCTTDNNQSLRDENDRRNYFMTNLHESMGPGRDRTRDPWICCQTRTCCKTRFLPRDWILNIDTWNTDEIDKLHCICANVLLSIQQISEYRLNMTELQQKPQLFSLQPQTLELMIYSKLRPRLSKCLVGGFINMLTFLNPLSQLTKMIKILQNVWS